MFSQAFFGERLRARVRVPAPRLPVHVQDPMPALFKCRTLNEKGDLHFSYDPRIDWLHIFPRVNISYPCISSSAVVKLMARSDERRKGARRSRSRPTTAMDLATCAPGEMMLLKVGISGPIVDTPQERRSPSGSQPATERRNFPLNQRCSPFWSFLFRRSRSLESSETSSRTVLIAA